MIIRTKIDRGFGLVHAPDENPLKPDGENVTYHYDNAGKLISVAGSNGNYTYPYIDSITYNLYGSRNRIVYGNGTSSDYAYHPLNLRLTNLKTYDANNDLMLDLSYDYDSAGNIEQIDNYANILSNSLGGQYSYSYTYDDLYRFTNAAGLFVSAESGSFSFETQMEYSASGNITNKDVEADLFINSSTQIINYSNQYSYNNRPHTVSQAGDYNYEWDANGNMILRSPINDGVTRRLCWDEENRLTTVRDAGGEPPMYLSSYIYNAAGERVWKLAGEDQLMWISGDVVVNTVNFDKTLYASPYMVLTDEEYTKHYYIEGERVCSKIGGGFGNAPNQINDPVPYLAVEPGQQSEDLWKMVVKGAECTGYNSEYVYMDENLESVENDGTGYETLRYFYHTDHLGSSSFISDASGNATQHLQYLPFGESFIDQQNGYDSRYKFSGKEKDDETQYSYFGARYYDSDLSVWLSVDPMTGKYPSMSPFMYCAGNPVLLIDKDGRDIWVGFEATHNGNSGHTTITYTTYKQVQVNVNGVMTTMYQQDGFAITEQNQYNRKVSTAMGDYQNWGSRSLDPLEINQFQYLSSKQDSRIKINTATGTEIDGTTYYTQEQILNELNLQKYAQNKEDNNIGKETFNLESNNCTDYAVEILRTLGIKTGGNEKTLIEHKSGKNANVSNPNALFKWMNSQIISGKKPLWKVEKGSDAIKEDPKPTMQNY